MAEPGSTPGVLPPEKFELRSRRLTHLERFCPECRGWHWCSRRVTHDADGRTYRSWVMLTRIRWDGEVCNGEEF